MGDRGASKEASWGPRGGSATEFGALPGPTSGTALGVINSWPSSFLKKVTTDTSA